MIRRELQTTLRQALERQAAVLLLGPRQVGKTTLALTLAQEQAAVYVDLERPVDLAKLDDVEQFCELTKGQLLILDEVHRVPELFAPLRGIIDERRRAGRRTGHFLLLGSASMALLRQSSETLAGRIAICELQTLNVREVLSQLEALAPDLGALMPGDMGASMQASTPVLGAPARKEEHSSPQAFSSQAGARMRRVVETSTQTDQGPAERQIPVLAQLWSRGGFPDSYLAAEDGQSLEWRQDFVRTYLERDVPQLGPRIPAETLRRLWTMLAHNQGQTFNAATLARGLGVSGVTVSRYLDLLVDLLLVRRLSAWTSNLGRRLVKAPKVYVRDSGICHALLGLRNATELLGHPVAGGSWEGFVLENIAGAMPRSAALGYYRTVGGAEVDVVLELRPGELWAIEIKRGTVPRLSRGFHSACEDLRPQRRFAIHAGAESYPLTAGVEAVTLPDFLDLLVANPLR